MRTVGKEYEGVWTSVKWEREWEWEEIQNQLKLETRERQYFGNLYDHVAK